MPHDEYTKKTRLWHTTASDGEEWQTAQHGIPMTSSGLKAKEEEYA